MAVCQNPKNLVARAINYCEKQILGAKNFIFVGLYSDNLSKAYYTKTVHWLATCQ